MVIMTIKMAVHWDFLPCDYTDDEGSTFLSDVG
jgi:hypothetical protein